MRLAFTRKSTESALAGSLLLRMRAWFARAEEAAAASIEPSQNAIEASQVTGNVASNVTASNVTSLGSAAQLSDAVIRQTFERTSAVVLAFPIYGEALLVKLAEQLRNKIAGSAMAPAFELAVLRQPHACLVLDKSAYIEFHADKSIYRFVVSEINEDTTIQVESGSFDTIVKFVAQYVADRLSTNITGEGAR